MSTDSVQAGDGDGPEVGPCRNAEEYAIELLESTDGPVTPAQAAEGHGCTPGYMQDVLRESEETVRVEIGEYALATEDTTEGADEGDGVESVDVAPFEASSGAEEEDTAIERPSVDGEARLQDTDGQAGDQEESETPTEAEETGGIPIPVSTTTLFVGVALVLVLMIWMRSGKSDDRDDRDDEDDQTDLFSPTEFVE